MDGWMKAGYGITVKLIDYDDESMINIIAPYSQYLFETKYHCRELTDHCKEQIKQDILQFCEFIDSNM